MDKAYPNVSPEIIEQAMVGGESALQPLRVQPGTLPMEKVQPSYEDSLKELLQHYNPVMFLQPSNKGQLTAYLKKVTKLYPSAVLVQPVNMTIMG